MWPVHYRNLVAGVVGLLVALLPRSSWSLGLGFLAGFLSVTYYSYLYGGALEKPSGRPWIPYLSSSEVLQEGSAFIVTQQGYAASAGGQEKVLEELKEGLTVAAVVVAITAAFLVR